MIAHLLLKIREAYHPLFYLRRYRLFREFVKLLDFTIGIRFPFVDHKIFISFSKNASLWLSRGEAGEQRERENFLEIVSRGGFTTFYDVGANVGVYAFMFKSRVERGRVLLFEPDPGNAARIRSTIANSSLGDVELLECAASDKKSREDFYVDEASSATGTIRDDGALTSFHAVYHGVTPNKIVVDTVTLDEIALSRFDPDIIKIDVEGAEAKAFAGAWKLIQRRPPAIMFECSTFDVSIREKLLAAGYELFDMETLESASRLHLNNLALHRQRHRDLIEAIRKRDGAEARRLAETSGA
ncbi:FkbM family methyltransferase [Methylosinus sp. Sm6]|uniref:FkbM family methyltransferase n=1 Tax=Methylosinus sp. Sm6 TaxID=2866948 RepID=UPI001C9A2959|nr:FkbM family methyltransferase [Methylosinus sp. Sm6]MBY6241125.1 FkbM family methyltransferase [Methylosinus sp. Sm6]